MPRKYVPLYSQRNQIVLFTILTTFISETSPKHWKFQKLCMPRYCNLRSRRAASLLHPKTVALRLYCAKNRIQHIFPIVYLKVCRISILCILLCTKIIYFGFLNKSFYKKNLIQKSYNISLQLDALCNWIPFTKLLLGMHNPWYTTDVEFTPSRCNFPKGLITNFVSHGNQQS